MYSGWPDVSHRDAQEFGEIAPEAVAGESHAQLRGERLRTSGLELVYVRRGSHGLYLSRRPPCTSFVRTTTRLLAPTGRSEPHAPNRTLRTARSEPHAPGGTLREARSGRRELLHRWLSPSSVTSSSRWARRHPRNNRLPIHRWARFGIKNSAMQRLTRPSTRSVSRRIGGGCDRACGSIVTSRSGPRYGIAARPAGSDCPDGVREFAD